MFLVVLLLHHSRIESGRQESHLNLPLGMDVVPSRHLTAVHLTRIELVLQWKQWCCHCNDRSNNTCFMLESPDRCEIGSSTRSEEMFLLCYRYTTEPLFQLVLPSGGSRQGSNLI